MTFGIYLLIGVALQSVNLVLITSRWMPDESRLDADDFAVPSTRAAIARIVFLLVLVWPAWVIYSALAVGCIFVRNARDRMRDRRKVREIQRRELREIQRRAKL